MHRRLTSKSGLFSGQPSISEVKGKDSAEDEYIFNPQVQYDLTARLQSQANGLSVVDSLTPS